MQNQWQPTSIEKIKRISPSSMHVIWGQTEAGDAYIKPLGGCKDGPHPLACEFVGSQLARWFELPIPPFAIMHLKELDVKIIQAEGGVAEVGPAFCSKAIPESHPWSGEGECLNNVENQKVIPKLVIFDTWTLNWDRHPPKDDRRKPNYDNVLLTRTGASKNKLRILAIDFGECFSKARTLNSKISHIDRIRSKKIYGLFPAFEKFMVSEDFDLSLNKLKSIDKTEIVKMVKLIPKEWQVEADACNALIELIIRRATFLSSNIQGMLETLKGE